MNRSNSTILVVSLAESQKYSVCIYTDFTQEQECYSWISVHGDTDGCGLWMQPVDDWEAPELH